MSKIIFVLAALFSFLSIGCAVTTSTAANHLAAQSPPMLVTIETDTVFEAALDSVVVDEDTLQIDPLIRDARAACEAAEYAFADSLLREAITIIDFRSTQTDSGDLAVESFFDTVATIYLELMPQEYIDNCPDQIAMIVFQHQIGATLDSVQITPNDTLLAERIRCQKGISYNVPVVWNDRVYKALRFLIAGKKGPLGRWIGRSTYYLPFMQKMFADSGLPTDLCYLPLIESGFSAQAYSYAHASGIWQFIAPTGHRFGLRTSYWLDERRDPIKSTLAAIGYLKKLNAQFNDWHCALAAYNCGENGLANAQNRAGSRDFWRLSLPRETMFYVPQYIAALMVAKNPTCFGITIDTSGAVFNLDTVSISRCIDMDRIAKALDVSLATLRSINPHILHWCTPPDINAVTLYLPSGTKSGFLAFVDSLGADDQVKFSQYQVKRRDTPSTIARKFGLTVAAIKTVNRLNDRRLKVGSVLLIPIPQGASSAFVKAEQAERTVVAREQQRSSRSIRYKVKSGQTLSGIAEMFKVSTVALCRWNRLSLRGTIHAGDMLTIYVPTAVKTVPAKTGSGTRRIYAVVAGDNLYAIAKKLSVTVDDLMSWNGIDEGESIRAGQRLAYYGGAPATSTAATLKSTAGQNRYIVAAGDNCTSIARMFKVDRAEFMRLNNLTDQSIMRTGDTVKLPAAPRSSVPVAGKSDGRIVYYKIRPGDNLSSIASVFGVSTDYLQKSNGLRADSVLMPGAVLKIVMAGNL